MYIYIYIKKILYKQGLSCQQTLSSKVLSVTNRASIFEKDINNNNQLLLVGVSWILPNLQMTIKYYLTCKNTIKT